MKAGLIEYKRQIGFSALTISRIYLTRDQGMDLEGMMFDQLVNCIFWGCLDDNRD